MARELKIIAPDNMVNPKIDLYDNLDTLVQSIALTPDANNDTVYTGTLTAPAGTYTSKLYDDNATRGGFTVRVLGIDPEELWIRDTVYATSGTIFKVS